MKDQIAITISSSEEVDVAFGLVGLRGGPRTGPSKRTKDDMEWYVVRRFLKEAISKGIFVPPISVRKGCPPDPDFVVVGADSNEIIALIEITEATDKSDQREMTETALSGQPTLLGAFGGRFSGGAANPKWAWAKDVIDAIERKEGKAIFSGSHPFRHLIIYPNSNASILLFSEDDERDAINALSSAVTAEAKPLAQLVNGCFVHILGKEHVCVDVLGRMSLVRRDKSAPLDLGQSV
jgi:hypothetical protein